MGMRIPGQKIVHKVFFHPLQKKTKTPQNSKKNPGAFVRQNFPLFNTPIDLAHYLWKTFLQKSSLNGKYVIDATCGNGKDSFFLATILESLKEKNTTLYCIDIQEKAFLATQKLLEGSKGQIQFILGSHERLPATKDQIELIVYNLGYLPGGDKSLTTTLSSTLSSIKCAIDCLAEGGLISITCYPGHPEGKKEEEALSAFLSTLDTRFFCFTAFYFQNRLCSPSLFLIQKTL